MNEFSTSDQVIELADRVINGTVSEDDVKALESILSKDPVARSLYLRYSLIHGLAGLTTDGLPTISHRFSATKATTDQPTASMRRPHRPVILGVAVTAATLLLAIFGLSLTTIPSANRIVGSSRNIQPTFQQENNRGAGLVAASADHAEWSMDDHYDNRSLPIHLVGFLGSDDSMSISPTTLTVTQGVTRIMSAGGADVQVEGPATFGVSSRAGGILFDGSVHARFGTPEATYSVQTVGARVVDLGTEFRVTMVDGNRIRVHSFGGEVAVQSRVRSPLYHWDFDKLSSPNSGMPDNNRSFETSDLAGHNVTTSHGVIGTGALHFENQDTSYVRIKEGTGPEVGTGVLSCSSGISIEALVICHWSGQFLDYDEIFRKEDGTHRMLLSFQNDGDVNDFDLPEVTPGPCLSFGLHLEQNGYSELDMPLDGQAGRPGLPELTDGKPHHIVATYDSFSGRKAIYVDGRLRFSHTFPVGTLVLCGGPMPAEIGNHQGSEPFTGTIDEVAFYDFALSPLEIKTHHERTQHGQPYFESRATTPVSDRWQAVTIVSADTSRLFDSLSGLPADPLSQRP